VETSKEFFLVSRSPRRIELLSRFGYYFRTLKPLKEEIKGSLDITPEEVLRRAENKVESVEKNGVLLAADTLVFVDNIALGKPKSIKEAKEFLRKLSGREHKVYTGVVIKCGDKKRKIIETTKVWFKDLKESEIEWIIEEDKSLDKAGGYAIQGVSGLFIDKIEGCYFNVIGLPVPSLYPILLEFGIKPSPLENRLQY